jgi:hypothetical protein
MIHPLQKGSVRRRNYGGIDATSKGAACARPYGRNNANFRGIAGRRGAGRVIWAGHRGMKQVENPLPPDTAVTAAREDQVRVEISKIRLENLRRMHKAQATAVRRSRILAR